MCPDGSYFGDIRGGQAFGGSAAGVSRDQPVSCLTHEVVHDDGVAGFVQSNVWHVRFSMPEKGDSVAILLGGKDHDLPPLTSSLAGTAITASAVWRGQLDVRFCAQAFRP